MEVGSRSSSDPLHLAELDFPLEDLAKLTSTQLALTQFNFESTPAITAKALALWWKRRAAAKESSRRNPSASTRSAPVPASAGEGSQVAEVVPKGFWEDTEKSLATRIGSPPSAVPAPFAHLPSRPQARRVDPVFQPLVHVLEDHTRRGTPRPLKCGVGSTLKQRYPHAYRDAGVTSFAAYAQKACDCGVCDQGRGAVHGRDWISLPCTVRDFEFVDPSPLTLVDSQPQPALPTPIPSLGNHTLAPQQQPRANASSQFPPLLDFLARRHQEGVSSHSLASRRWPQAGLPSFVSRRRLRGVQGLRARSAGAGIGHARAR